MKVNRVSIIILIVVMSIAVISAVIVSSLAIWTETYEDDKTSTIPVGEYNPSEKHIIFAPLDDNGNFITDYDLAISYAAVGYTGMVAELEIPSHYQPEGYASLPVTAILVHENYENEAFAGNGLIKEIIIPHTVTKIGAHVFSNLDVLEKIIIKKDDVEDYVLTIADYAFQGAPELKVVENRGRTVSGIKARIFYNCPYINDLYL